jgi:hypothetical protein
MWARGMAQAIERLLCKCKALSSNPNTAKHKKKQNILVTTLG